MTNEELKKLFKEFNQNMNKAKEIMCKIYQEADIGTPVMYSANIDAYTGKIDVHVDNCENIIAFTKYEKREGRTMYPTVRYATVDNIEFREIGEWKVRASKNG